ncbi:MAG: Ig-like domain-containing protein [Gemmatimonadetes bacterium]|nr:Ig-like domain-containing protein [Gemmatimonadota bacterium]
MSSASPSGRRLARVLSIVFSYAFVACSEPAEPKSPSISDVTIQIQGGRSSLSVGESTRADLSPIGLVPGARLSSRWSSSNPAVLSVAGDGSSATLTAVAAGSAEVIVDVSAEGSKSAPTSLPARRLAITVQNPPPALSGTISVSPAQVRLGIGANLTVVPQVSRAAPSVNVEWQFTSSDPSRFTVSSSGMVTGISPTTGVVQVTARGTGAGYSASTLTAQIPVTVLPPALDSIAVSPVPMHLVPGRAKSITVQPFGVDAAVARVTFQSADPGIATVSSNGVVTGIRAGATSIVVTADAPQAASGTDVTLRRTLPVVVADGVLSVVISPRAMVLRPGRSTGIAVDVAATGAVPRTSRLSSTNPAVVTVAPSGTVTGVGIGSAYVRAVATADSTVGDSVLVTVLPLVRLSTISGDGQSSREGQTLTQPLVVRASDPASGARLSGVPIDLAVTDNSGATSPSRGSTDANGEFRFSWTQGRRMGLPNEPFAPHVRVTSAESGDTLRIGARVACWYQSAFALPVSFSGQVGSSSPCLWTTGTGVGQYYGTRSLLEVVPAGIYRVQASSTTGTYSLWIGERLLTSFDRGRWTIGLHNIAVGSPQSFTMLWMTPGSRLSLEPFRDSAQVGHAAFSVSLSQLPSDLYNCALGMPTLVGSGALSQTIAPGDCLAAGRPGDQFYVPVNAGETITLRASSSAFTPRVVLYTWNGTAWQEVAAHAGTRTTPAAIAWTNAGDGLIGYARIESIEPTGGGYTLTSQYASSAALLSVFSAPPDATGRVPFPRVPSPSQGRSGMRVPPLR